MKLEQQANPGRPGTNWINVPFIPEDSRTHPQPPTLTLVGTFYTLQVSESVLLQQ